MIKGELNANAKTDLFLFESKNWYSRLTLKFFFKLKKTDLFLFESKN